MGRFAVSNSFVIICEELFYRGAKEPAVFLERWSNLIGLDVPINDGVLGGKW